MSLLELLDDLWRNLSTRAQFLDDCDGFLAANGFGTLDGPLLAEAMSNVAAGLPVETAEHLSAYMVANSPLPPEHDSIDFDPSDPATGLNLLATAPTSPPVDIDDGTDAEGHDLDDAGAFGAGVGPDAELDLANGEVDNGDVDTGDLGDVGDVGDIGNINTKPAIVTDQTDDPFADIDGISVDDTEVGDSAGDIGPVADDYGDLDDGFDA